MRARKRRRMVLVAAIALAASVSIGLVLVVFQDNIMFFYSPSDLAEKGPPGDRRFRLGGLVEDDSVVRAADGVTIRFRVTDTAHTVPVVFRDLLPDLFREGQGVVAIGHMNAQGVFEAQQILAKHDETYMPAEVADALKKSGQWKGSP